MFTYKALFYILFLWVTDSSESPFVFDDLVQYCSYSANYNSKNSIQTTSKTRFVKYDPVQIYFQLCKTFESKGKCPMGTAACLENHKTGEKIVLGSSFVSGNNLLQSTNGDYCTEAKTYSLVVHFRSSSGIPSYLRIEDKCTYHVEMMHPTLLAKCGVDINGRFLDLTSLAISYNIDTPERNFSISLCGSDKSCVENSVNACEIRGTTIIPLSLTSRLSPTYNGEKNEISFHGSTIAGPTHKIDKRFELTLKCDWDKTEFHNNDLTFVKKQIQGKRFSFELKTAYGCVTESRPCVVHDGFLVYDLSNLYKDHPEMWSTHGGTSVYFMQICGPAELARKNTKCKSTYAKVCEHVNGIDTNRGSILSHLEVAGDGLTAIIDSGTSCKEKEGLLYKTIIKFNCDFEEQGPKFLRHEGCDTYFQWKTHHACPKYNTTSCTYIHNEFHDCIFNKNNNLYNLSDLTATQTMKNKTQNLQFKFNICGPVLDEDAPCMKDVSVVMKNLSEPNIYLRVISLGKFYGGAIKSGSLALEYTFGRYCDGIDYRSEIRFECSDVEEDPIIIKQEKCYFTFLWKTKKGCPHPKSINTILGDLDVSASCFFVDYRTNNSIDFGYITPIEFDDVTYKSIFHVCGRFYSNCTSSEECTNISFENPVATLLGNVTTLEFNLHRKCVLADQYNKVTFQFKCDRIKNNAHLGSWKKEDCNLSVDYYIDTVCSFQDTSSSVEKSVIHPKNTQENNDSKIPDNVPKESPLKKVLDCSIKSPFTDQELNMSEFTKNAFFKNNCPTDVTFNDTFRFVKLLYPSNDVCRPVPIKNISYEVYLRCTKSDIDLSSGNEDCLQHYNYEQIEYCNLFELTKKSNIAVVTGSVLGCMLMIALVPVGILVRKRSTCCSKLRRVNSEFTYIYERDTQI